jgi:hypothetical protein
MASVKLEDCSQALELNVIIKDEEEEEEEKIGTSVSHGKSRFYLTMFVVHSNFSLCMKSYSRTVSY